MRLVWTTFVECLQTARKDSIGQEKRGAVAKRRKSIRGALQSRIPRGASLLLAVSGGKDSMALLHSLASNRRLFKTRIEVCHVDHGLRIDSANHAKFVMNECEKLSVRCHTVKLPRKPRRQNLEGWARELRYAALTACRNANDLEYMVTAHTANDVAETLLMRLIANKELSGIREFDEERRLIRPFIEISREQIEQYISRHEIPWVEDDSNADISFVRNRIRHEVIPPLQQLFGESVVWSLAERGQALNADYAGLREVVQYYVRVIGCIEADSEAWRRGFLGGIEKVPQSLKWRIVQELLRVYVPRGISEQKAKDVLNVILLGRGKVQLSRDLFVVLSKRGVSFCSE